jgi:hypothetical protein
MKVSTENDNNFGHEKITIVVDNIPLKQTWHEWSLNGQLSKLYPVTQTSIQDGHHQQT